MTKNHRLKQLDTVSTAIVDSIDSPKGKIPEPEYMELYTTIPSDIHDALEKAHRNLTMNHELPSMEPNNNQ